MTRIARALGPILSVLAVAALAACAAPAAQSAEPQSSPGHARVCKIGGSQCRWDNQCCSGRCYVDTGCSG